MITLALSLITFLKDFGDIPALGGSITMEWILFWYSGWFRRNLPTSELINFNLLSWLIFAFSMAFLIEDSTISTLIMLLVVCLDINCPMVPVPQNKSSIIWSFQFHILVSNQLLSDIIFQHILGWFEKNFACLFQNLIHAIFQLLLIYQLLV